MKKLLVFVSCVAMLLILSNMSFAQEEAVPAPCTCCYCSMIGAQTPFAYHAPKRAFGERFSAAASNCPFVQMAKAPGFQPSPQLAYAGSDAPHVRPLAARRAARQAQQAYPPYAMPVPGAVMPAPGAPPQFVGAPAIPATQMGDSNRVYQRASVGGAPVINFLSVVRQPQTYPPYAGYGYTADASGEVAYPAALPPTTMGDRNKVFQRASVGGAPVVNFMSFVRPPQAYGTYPQPEVTIIPAP